MQVHYVTPIVFGVVVALFVFALMVLVGRAAQTGHPPPLSPRSATTILDEENKAPARGSAWRAFMR